MNTKIRGVFTALITPFDEEGEIDEKVLRQLIDFQINSGISGVVPCGTTGESPTLSHEEHDRVIQLTIDHVNKRIPVIAGTGSNSTREAIRLSQHAEKSGADGVMVVNPYYNKPTQEGLYRHFREIADSIDVSCIIYNIQSRTGVNLETSTLIRLCNSCKNIVAVKEASGNLNQIRDVIEKTGNNFSVLSGDDNMTLPLIKAGGDGVISTASNLIPDKMLNLVQTALEGNFQQAEILNSELSDLFEALFVETNPIPIKAAMAMAGYCLEQYRLPMCPLSSHEKRSQLKQTLIRTGILAN